jgi:hypothetical protein
MRRRRASDTDTDTDTDTDGAAGGRLTGATSGANVAT